MQGYNWIPCLVALLAGGIGGYLTNAANAECLYETEVVSLELQEVTLESGVGDVDAEQALWEGSAEFDAYGWFRGSASDLLIEASR